ncbi:MAG: NADH-quinone oxidoreductase subunit N [Dysgonamonadaceae bacterium]|jgi:NADH-quinone oxidoreductase subunit N|nr:NADH-quinone oxidoreductase subunit N [Dysgonamonadaceae bacterium]
MDFNNFLLMGQEIGLIAVFLILFAYDIIASDKLKRWFYPVACFLFAVQTAWGFFPLPAGEAFGGLYVASGLTVLMKNILNIATLLVFLQSYTWLNSEGTRHKAGEFFTIALVTLLGMYLMVSAGNFMMLYIGMETASLPLACLAAFNKYKEKSAEAGVKYILISAFSSGILLFGLSFIYGAIGSLYFSDITLSVVSEPLTILGFVFFFGGLGFKLSLVPFHLWTADVYEGAPTSVTAYLSVVSKGAAAFALLFALYKAFGQIEVVWEPVLWWLSVITITLGNLFAIRQTDIKRFFAFSSISQAGYILLGVIAGNAQGMTATVYYVLVYVFSNLAAFGVISAVENASGGKTSIAAFNGLYKTNPLLSFVMMLAVFSLGGIPPFAGFFSKFFIFMAAASEGHYLLVFIALLNTVISLYYYLLIIKAMFIKEGEPDATGRFSSDVYNKTSLALCTLGIFVVGILACIYENIGNISFGI